jgi:hypothetical protein
MAGSVSNACFNRVRTSNRVAESPQHKAVVTAWVAAEVTPTIPTVIPAEAMGSSNIKAM